MPVITLATEDELSEAVGLKLADEAGLSVDQQLRKSGFGYLKKRTLSFCEIAQHRPVFLLTDLDAAACPSWLIADWMRERPRPPRFLFRVAVREIESWILADHEGVRRLIGSRVNPPRKPEGLDDPKRKLIELARRHAAKEVRLDLVPALGALATQGLGYNTRLVPWVQNVWNPEAAAQRAPSLARTRLRLRELAASLGV